MIYQRSTNEANSKLFKQRFGVRSNRESMFWRSLSWMRGGTAGTGKSCALLPLPVWDALPWLPACVADCVAAVCGLCATSTVVPVRDPGVDWMRDGLTHKTQQPNLPTPVFPPPTHTHPLNGPFPGLPRWASNRKVKPIWILWKQETVSGSGISWTTCKSAPRSGQIAMPAPHHSVFYRPDQWGKTLKNAENCIRVHNLY